MSRKRTKGVSCPPSSRGAGVARQQHRHGGGEKDGRTDREGQGAEAADGGEHDRTRHEAERQDGGVDAHDEAAPAGGRQRVDPEFGEHEGGRDRAVEDDAQREPGPEGLDHVEEIEAQAGDDHHPEGEPGRADALGQRRDEGRDGDGGDAGKGGVDAGPGGRDAAGFQKKGEQRQAEPERDADGGDGRDRGRKPAPARARAYRQKVRRVGLGHRRGS